MTILERSHWLLAEFGWELGREASNSEAYIFFTVGREGSPERVVA